MIKGSNTGLKLLLASFKIINKSKQGSPLKNKNGTPVEWNMTSTIPEITNNNKSFFYLPREHAQKMYVSMEQNAMLFTTTYWFAFRYFKDVEDFRPDISIILTSDLSDPQHFNQVTPKRFPTLNFPNIESKRENLHEFIQLLISENIIDQFFLIR